MKRSVLVGMSGGVDSSVAALLLKEQGFDVAGVTLRLCPDASESDIEDARQVAALLGIEHHVIDLRDLFKRNVIDYFTGEYIGGKTPNPCVVCNRQIKFGAMLACARDIGMDYIATGHYARIDFEQNTNRWLLKKSPSPKDQSYVLYTLTQEQLSRSLFPLERYPKEEIRKIAADRGLPVASKSDSQDICFIKDGDHAAFIERTLDFSVPPGNFIDQEGLVIGRHKGIIHYTVGQRKGLGVSFGQPMFVTRIDSTTNTVTLGNYESQFRQDFRIRDANWIPFEVPNRPFYARVKVRYHAKPAVAQVFPESGNTALVKLAEPQKAIAPGQSAVFYREDLVLGGGVITESF